MRCKHNFVYSQGHFRCTKCHKKGKERHYKKNHNKSYAAAVIVGIVILVAVVINANYDITIANQKIDEIIPVDSIQNTIDDIYEEIPFESFEDSFDDISSSIPIKIEPKSETLESKLEDCSKYKNEVKHSTDVDKIFAAVQKTDACEQRNKQIEIKQGSVTTQSGNYPTVTVKMDNKPSGGATADFKINTVRVVDSDYYKIININMQMTTHMKLQDRIYFSPTVMWNLKSPSGEIYPEQCHGRQYDTQIITGKQNPNITWDICYHVEKELDKFDLIWGLAPNQQVPKIGTIILD